MKKFIKVICLVLICGLMLCACKEEKLPVEEPKEEDKNVQIEKNIKNSEVRLFYGEFNDRTVVLKVQNNNNKPVYLNYSFEMYDSSMNKLFNKEVYVRVGRNDSAYVVAIQDLEEPTFNSYSYKMSVLDEELVDYDDIKRGVKVSYRNDVSKLITTFENKGNRTTTAYGLFLFYKNNSLVAVKDAISYNLVPYNTEDVIVEYPLMKIDKRIDFDSIELVVNEVSTEL